MATEIVFGRHALWQPKLFLVATEYSDQSFSIAKRFITTEMGLVSIIHKFALGNPKML